MSKITPVHDQTCVICNITEDNTLKHCQAHRSTLISNVVFKLLNEKVSKLCLLVKKEYIIFFK